VSVVDMTDLHHLRRNRSVCVQPLSLSDLSHADIQKHLDSDKCEEAKLQMIRPTGGGKTWQVVEIFAGI